MRKQVFTTVATASLLITLVIVTSYAETSERAEATIPFEFTAWDSTAPAGFYTVGECPSNGVLRIQDAKGQSFFVPTQCLVNVEAGAKAELTFHRYGNRYFLAAVSFAGMRGYVVRMSTAEREIRNSQTKSLVKNDLKPELVFVDAQ
jgi:hypothetical protein